MAVVVGAVGVGDVELSAHLEIALWTSLQCNLLSYQYVRSITFVKAMVLVPSVLAVD